ncbi:DUF6527 family protein [Pedobacter gandavensis]|uniref:DUF6527 family protein n=1 Tax=Pedobacter gandavensis TaxID=2679963 RepID=UPI002478D656|nr:DUF6527 family protein [Pedobacter gandavensis]WGQ11866.1 DUF6527 family protein [Pedobacter gandavensis]
MEFIPEELEEGILYITMEYRTAVHKCVCGCGNEVITPFSPTDWQLRFYGDSVSIYPSIGSWSFRCRSHYWITKNRIEHAESWNDKEIQQGRNVDKKNKQNFYSEKPSERKLQKPEIKVNKERKEWSVKSFFSFLGFK